MADGKRWFKVWTAILSDPHFCDLHNQTIGAWLRLAALVALHGTDGTITVSETQFLRHLHMEKASEDEILRVCAELGIINVIIEKADRYKCNVTFVNWIKYQANSESYERVMRYRKKQKETHDVTLSCNADKEEKRREEKRQDKKRKEENNTEKKLPDWIDHELWEAWKEKRREIKKPLTGKAEELAIEKLAKLRDAGNDPSEVIKESITNSWQGLFALKEKKGTFDWND